MVFCFFTEKSTLQKIASWIYALLTTDPMFIYLWCKHLLFSQLPGWRPDTAPGHNGLIHVKCSTTVSSIGLPQLVGSKLCAWMSHLIILIDDTFCSPLRTMNSAGPAITDLWLAARLGYLHCITYTTVINFSTTKKKNSHLRMADPAAA